MSCYRFGLTSCRSDSKEMLLYLGRIDDVITAGVQYGVSALFPYVWKCWLVCVCVLFEADGAEFAAVRIERHRTETARDKCEKQCMQLHLFLLIHCELLYSVCVWCSECHAVNNRKPTCRLNRTDNLRKNVVIQLASVHYGDALEKAEVYRTGQTGGNEGIGGGVNHALLRR